MSDKIFIKDLIIEMFIGIYDHEKSKKQRVIINIDLDVESNFKKTLSSIDDVVSYEKIVNNIQELTNSKHYELLEDLAEEIALICTENVKVITANIRLEKPDIIDNVKSVGIEIKRPNNITNNIKCDDAQKGNVLIIILIAVALFAALSYTVSNMMRGGTDIGREKAGIYVSEILTYSQSISEAVQMLRISNGCLDTNISFSNNINSGYSHSPEVSNECKVFHANGGGIAYQLPIMEVNNGLKWIFTGNNRIHYAGDDAVADLVMIIPDIAKTICLQLNKNLGISNIDGDAPSDTDDVDITKFIGSYIPSAQIGSAYDFRGRLTGCYKHEQTTPNTYNFYRVLLAR